MMKQRIFSGIQPSGALHIGNYLGAIKRFVTLQEEHEAYFCVVDEHAITVPQDPARLRADILSVAVTYLAAGIDPARSVIFVQSHVPAHAELGWILNTMTPMGELERMTQFKDKARKQRAGVFAGLFNYPTLMAADILLYQTDLVPVGEDQRQHIELTRSLAERFNHRYGETFRIPKILVSGETARILSLTNPSEKMSKSDPNDKSRINLMDSPDLIREKIKAAVTDSGSEIRFAPDEKPAISNLLAIFSGFSGKTIRELEAEYAGKNYVDFKNDLADAVVAGMRPFQERFRELFADPQSVLAVLRDGSERAAAVAGKTIAAVKEKIGFI